jgi:2',3'-cyclic-nucleotide 2'-phosphodiesterase (5'-nucleotidase family)
MFRLMTGLFIFLLFSCRQAYEVKNTDTQFVRPAFSSAGVPEDSSVIRLSDPYRREMSEKMNVVLARSAQPMEKGQPESVLGNFVADLCFDLANRYNQQNSLPPGDFCILNNGGLRSSLPEGDLMLRHAYELMPFDNELVVIEMNGQLTARVFDYIAQKGGVPVSGLKMNITDGKATDVIIGGKPFDPSNSYRLVTSDYLAGGGDAMNMFGEAASRYGTGIKVRDAIITRLTELGKQNKLAVAKKDGRITK